MFRNMRRTNQKLSKDDCLKIIKEEPRGVLAVSGDNNYPYTIPLNFVFKDNTIYFHGNYEGHKVDSIERNDKVSFSIIDKGVKLDNQWWYTFKSVIIFGKIKKVIDKSKIEEILYLFGDKYFPDEVSTRDEVEKYRNSTLILELSIEHISGKLVNEK